MFFLFRWQVVFALALAWLVLAWRDYTEMVARNPEAFTDWF